MIGIIFLWNYNLYNMVILSLINSFIVSYTQSKTKYDVGIKPKYELNYNYSNKQYNIEYTIQIKNENCIKYPTFVYTNEN